MNVSLYELQKDMSVLLDEKRFYHALGVQTTCFSIALCHDADVEKATYAGVLHDIAKCLSDKELIEESEKLGLEITETERIAPYLLHGKLGAKYVERKYGIKDEELLMAIRYHTTGRPGMTMIEKMVFVADFIEPNRRVDQIPRLHEIRLLAFHDLNKAVLCVLENTLTYLRKQNSTIDSLSLDAYEYYKNIQ